MTDINILIVDDEPANIQILHASLKNMGRVLFATSGAKALEIAEQTDLNLIFLDLVMPEMDGLEVCKRIKANPKTAGALITFISGDASQDQIEKALDVGAFDFMSKPIVPALVQRRTEIALKLCESRTQQALRMDAGPSDVRKVLVVEDGEINRMIIAEVLKQKDYQVQMASTAKEALDLIKETSFECVLLDIHLPDMTGLKVIQHIRAMPGVVSQARIIAVTGDVTLESLHDYNEAGFDAVSPKPIDPEKLLAQVAGMQVNMEQVISSAPDVGGPDLLIDPERLSILKKTYTKDKLDKLYGLFVREVTAYLDVLQDKHRMNESAEVSQTAHRLKSALGHFACAKMQTVADLISKDSEMPVPERQRLIHVLEEQLKPTLMALEGALDIEQ